MPMKKRYVKEGKIGELLVKLWRHPKETRENKLLLHEIIEDWLRLVTGMSSSFSDDINETIEDAAKVKAAYLSSINRNRGERCITLFLVENYTR